MFVADLSSQSGTLPDQWRTGGWMTTAGSSCLREDGITSLRKALRDVADCTLRFHELPTASYWNSKPTGVSELTHAFGCPSKNSEIYEFRCGVLSLKPKNRVHARS
jgi:hypothetical protein